jgi:hypothetical protein
MNERIREIALQVYGSAATAQEIKFAELIVQECMTTILKESKWYWDKDEFESANAVQNAVRRLKEHFGVE